ncbi:hypothetical protein VM1G_11750 [Cytospora mali]|uniref:Uncharacterized protein n=1 Tax=Cytospora mali TaxID=578113 RepID=A0A194W5Q5_CYTMA|nr:hypothetical protein VM1G_11750 [Valsa mali]
MRKEGFKYKRNTQENDNADQIKSNGTESQTSVFEPRLRIAASKPIGFEMQVKLELERRGKQEEEQR